jgi:cytochrome c551/c552
MSSLARHTCHDVEPTMPFCRISFCLPLASLVALPLVIACGAAAPEPVSPSSAAPQPSAAPVEAALPAAWSDAMPREQQVVFMKTKVMPVAAATFKDHDATKYGNTDCKLCHGPDRKNPKDFLPRLTMKGGELTAFAEKPEMSKFMAESVGPKVAAAMGLPPYDRKTHQGFGCGGCHAIDQK